VRRGHRKESFVVLGVFLTLSLVIHKLDKEGIKMRGSYTKILKEEDLERKTWKSRLDNNTLKEDLKRRL